MYNVTTELLTLVAHLAVQQPFCAVAEKSCHTTVSITVITMHYISNCKQRKTNVNTAAHTHTHTAV